MCCASTGASYLIPRVLVFVTVETQQLPVAPIGWIVVVVMVPVMDRKLAKFFRRCSRDGTAHRSRDIS